MDLLNALQIQRKIWIKFRNIVLIFFFVFSSKIFSDVLAPSSIFQNEIQRKEFRYHWELDFNILRDLQFQEDIVGQDFFSAVRYFNAVVLNQDKMDWGNILDLYERIRGDHRHPRYDAFKREKRYISLLRYFPNQRDINIVRQLYEDKTSDGQKRYQDFLKQLKHVYAYPDAIKDSKDLMGLIHRTATTKEEAVNMAAEIYTYFSYNQLLTDEKLGRGLPGFGYAFPRLGTDAFYVDGHHRLAWFLMNFFLIRNGYSPIYFDLGHEYISVKDKSKNYLIPLLRKRIVHYQDPASLFGDNPYENKLQKLLEKSRLGLKLLSILRSIKNLWPGFPMSFSLLKPFPLIGYDGLFLDVAA